MLSQRNTVRMAGGYLHPIVTADVFEDIYTSSVINAV